MRTPETEPKQNLAKQLAENALDQFADALAGGKSEIGLNTGTTSADHIQLWDGYKITLSQSLQFIQSIAIQILTAIGAAENGLR